MDNDFSALVVSTDLRGQSAKAGGRESWVSLTIHIVLLMGGMQREEGGTGADGTR